MCDELVKRMRDSEHEIDCSLCDRDCCYPDGKVHGKCIIIEAADAIEDLEFVCNRYEKDYKDLCSYLPRWIPVTERLPKAERKSYWVCTDTGYQCECRWTNDRFGIIESDEWGWKIFDIPQYQKVVAWMPLPDPYEQPKEET